MAGGTVRPSKEDDTVGFLSCGSRQAYRSQSRDGEAGLVALANVPLHFVS